jgi:hypothetical protein
MPAGDRSGPRGMGPMTGRGFGYCAGYGAPGYAYPGPGRGMGQGWGMGGGWGRGWRRRNWYYATGLPGWARFGYGPAWETPPAWGYGPYAAAPTREQETEFLRQQAEWLKQQLDDIGRRIEELGQEQ